MKGCNSYLKHLKNPTPSYTDSYQRVCPKYNPQCNRRFRPAKIQGIQMSLFGCTLLMLHCILLVFYHQSVSHTSSLNLKTAMPRPSGMNFFFIHEGIVSPSNSIVCVLIMMYPSKAEKNPSNKCIPTQEYLESTYLGLDPTTPILLISAITKTL